MGYFCVRNIDNEIKETNAIAELLLVSLSGKAFIYQILSCYIMLLMAAATAAWLSIEMITTFHIYLINDKANQQN